MTENTRGYDRTYDDFDSPSMRRMRAEAYGEDIGQHSWVTAEELRADIPALGLTAEGRLLDLGCGPGGPLTFVAGIVGCRGVGMDVSAPAIAAGRARATALGLADRVTFEKADLNDRVPLADRSCDAVLSLDAILHLRDRAAAFREVARVLRPGGRFLFTDAGVVTGAISEEEARRRSVHGYTQLVAPGFNESALAQSGLRPIGSENRTPGLIRVAKARLAARKAHRAALEEREGPSRCESQERYLETVVALAERGALSRMMYLTESPPGPA